MRLSFLELLIGQVIHGILRGFGSSRLSEASIAQAILLHYQTHNLVPHGVPFESFQKWCKKGAFACRLMSSKFKKVKNSSEGAKLPALRQLKSDLSDVSTKGTPRVSPLQDATADKPNALDFMEQSGIWSFLEAELESQAAAVVPPQDEPAQELWDLLMAAAPQVPKQAEDLHVPDFAVASMSVCATVSVYTLQVLDAIANTPAPPPVLLTRKEDEPEPVTPEKPCTLPLEPRSSCVKSLCKLRRQRSFAKRVALKRHAAWATEQANLPGNCTGLPAVHSSTPSAAEPVQQAVVAAEPEEAASRPRARRITATEPLAEGDTCKKFCSRAYHTARRIALQSGFQGELKLHCQAASQQAKDRWVAAERALTAGTRISASCSFCDSSDCQACQLPSDQGS